MSGLHFVLSAYKCLVDFKLVNLGPLPPIVSSPAKLRLQSNLNTTSYIFLHLNFSSHHKRENPIMMENLKILTHLSPKPL